MKRSNIGPDRGSVVDVVQRKRIVSANLALLQSVQVVEKEYKLTIFELLFLLSDLQKSFAKNGMELEQG